MYSQPSKPHMLSNEPDLGFAPVAVTMSVQGEKLAKESRAFYAKLEHIEHNHPVRFIGSVHPDFLSIVEDAVDVCWTRNKEKETRHHQGKKHGKIPETLNPIARPVSPLLLLEGEHTTQNDVRILIYGGF